MLYFLWFVLVVLIAVLKTVRTNLWKSDKPVLNVLVLWKESALFVQNKSTQIGFEILLKQVF